MPEEGPQTAFELACHIRRRVPEILLRCGKPSMVLNGWLVRGSELVPFNGGEDFERDEFDACFYKDLLCSNWLRSVSWAFGRVGMDLVSPLLIAWDERLREMLEEERRAP